VEGSDISTGSKGKGKHSRIKIPLSSPRRKVPRSRIEKGAGVIVGAGGKQSTRKTRTGKIEYTAFHEPGNQPVKRESQSA